MITYVRGSGLGLEVYTDADYANKGNDGSSVSEIEVTLGGTIVSHPSKTEHVVSLSTYRGRVHCGWGRSQGSSVCACRFVFHCARDEWGKH